MFWVTLLLLAVAYAPCSIGLSLPVKRKYRAVIALGLFFFAIAVQFVIFTGILPRIALPSPLCRGSPNFSGKSFLIRAITVSCSAMSLPPPFQG